LNDLHVKAWRLMAATTPKLSQPNVDSAIYKYWQSHKEVGTPMCDEVPVVEGGTALYTSTGRILHWLGGEDVEVL
jgi:hypothetical protein